MSSELFRYTGPARIGGLLLPEVRLWEERDQSETGRVLLRSWQGSATVLAADIGDPTKLLDRGQVPIELTGGSEVLTAQAFVSAVSTFDDNTWSIEIMGLGPAPGCE